MDKRGIQFQDIWLKMFSCHPFPHVNIKYGSRYISQGVLLCH